MPLRKGDVISLTLNPVIRFTQYDSFKTMVTIRRTLTDDVEGDVTDAIATLRQLYFRALKREVSIYCGITREFAVEDHPKKLLKICRKELVDATPEIIVEPGDGQAGKPIKKAPRAVKL
jgi:hypothetical protein